MSDAAPAKDGNGRRRGGWIALLVLGAAFVALTRLASPPARDAIACDRDLAPDADTVVMLSASWCGYCRRARAFMQDRGIRHCEYDVETTDEGRRRFAAMPVKVVPVIQVREDTLVGFSRTELMQTLVAHDLASLDDYEAAGQ